MRYAIVGLMMVVAAYAAPPAAKDGSRISVGDSEASVVKKWHGTLKGKSEGGGGDRPRRYFTHYTLPDPEGVSVTCEKGKVFSLTLEPKIGMDEDTMLHYNHSAYAGALFVLKHESKSSRDYVSFEGGVWVHVDIATKTVSDISRR